MRLLILIPRLIKLSLQARHFRLLTVILTGLHVILTAQPLSEDYAFTLICLAGFVFANRLEGCVLSVHEQVFRWLVLLVIEVLIGLQISRDHDIAAHLTHLFGIHFSEFQAGLVITAILIVCEILGTIWDNYDERPVVLNLWRPVFASHRLAVPIDIEQAGSITVDVKAPLSSSQFVVEMSDKRLENGHPLHSVGNLASGEFHVAQGRAFLILTNLDPKNTVLLHIIITRPRHSKAALLEILEEFGWKFPKGLL